MSSPDEIVTVLLVVMRLWALGMLAVLAGMGCGAIIAWARRSRP